MRSLYASIEKILLPPNFGQVMLPCTTALPLLLLQILLLQILLLLLSLLLRIFVERPTRWRSAI